MVVDNKVICYNKMFMPIFKRGKTGQRFNWWIIVPVWAFCGLLGFAGTNLWLNPSLRIFFKSDYWQSVSKFEEALRLVNAEYVDQNASNLAVLTNQAIDGMLTKLDRHSRYFDSSEYKIFQDDTHRSYVGVGIMIRLNDGKVAITRVFPSSPAINAGLAVGDAIKKVDDFNVEGLSLEQVSSRIKGRPGTQVKLTIQTLSGLTKDVLVTRQNITVSTVDSYHLDTQGTGYVHLIQFTEKTGEDLENALMSLKLKGMKRLVLDLRDNAGGLLTGAIKVVSLFIPQDEFIVSVKGRGIQPERIFKSSGNGPYLNIPLALLINEGSASASEIVAGALSKLGRALLVGEKSYGKGSVQTIFSLPDATGMKLTTAMYFFADNTTIHETGIEPEHFVPCSEENETKLRLQRHSMHESEGKSFIDLYGFAKIKDEQLHRARTLLLAPDDNGSK